MGREKLKVGLLVDSLVLPAWIHLMLTRIAEADHNRIALVVQNDVARPVARPGLLPKLARTLRRREYLFYELFHRYELRRFRHHEPNAFEPTDATELLGGVPTIKVVPRQRKFSDWINKEDVAEIRTHDIDVFIRLGFRILRGSILQSSKYGVWSFHHGDNDVVRGGPAGFWEVLERHPWTGITLQILNEDFDNGPVLYRSYSSTHPLSVRLNCQGYYWKGASFIPRRLRDLHRLGEQGFRAKVELETREIPLYSRRSYSTPTNSQFVRPFSRFLAHYVKYKAQEYLCRDQWILMFDLREGISTSFWRFKRLLPPRDRFWADPHVVQRDGRYYIFFEEFPFSTGKGFISVMVMDQKGNVEKPVKVLERPYHLSYPFLFEWQGEQYMIPETMNNRTIEVYRCVQFPDRWELHATLMDQLDAVDATLHFHEGKWWLFANQREHPGVSSVDELFLYSSDDPLGTDWKPHPMNPIVSDVRRARPAGRILRHNGRLYRPAQDGSGGYGRGLSLQRIEKLDETEYAERQACAAEPDWDKDVLGLHTFSHEGDLTMIDARIRTPRWRATRR